MAGRGAEGGGMVVGNLFKPPLACGKLRCISASIFAECWKYTEMDAALKQWFTQVITNDPTVSELISILHGIQDKYEVHHGVRIVDPALISTVRSGHNYYMISRHLPNSAIDLIDEAWARYVERITAYDLTDFSLVYECMCHAGDGNQGDWLCLIEIHALDREKDAASKEPSPCAQKAIVTVKDELKPLRVVYETQKKRGDAINTIRCKIDELNEKAANIFFVVCILNAWFSS